MRTACYSIAMVISIAMSWLIGPCLSNDIKLAIIVTVTAWVSFLLGAASEIFRK